MTNQLRTIEIEHHEIHEGESFSAVYQATKDDAETLDLQITTPATEYLHSVLEASSTLEAEVALYEAPTTSGGTAVTAYNRNRNSQNVAAATVAHTPTVSAVGTLLAATTIGTGKSVGGNLRGISEWILKPSTKYLLRITSGSNGNIITATLDWYRVEKPDAS